MKRKRLSSEIRFRVSKTDLERIDWLIQHHPDQPLGGESLTVSALLRLLIFHATQQYKGK